MYDVFSLVKDKEIKCLDKGFVRLIDSMPRLCEDGQTADSAVVQAARVSYGGGTKTLSEDAALIRYLIRHMHTTPLEMVEFKFHCKMPIFVARQWIRHRTASTNELSLRYSEPTYDFYIPEVDNVRKQSANNKQCSDGQILEEEANEFIENLQKGCKLSVEDYLEAVHNGIGREQARIGIPVNLYTEWYWKIDLHNLLHFLGLRADKHAQKEIQDYANAIITLIEPIVPVVIAAWNQYSPLRNGMLLTELEIESLRTGQPLFSPNKREREEWEAKKKVIFKND